MANPAQEPTAAHPEAWGDDQPEQTSQNLPVIDLAGPWNEEAQDRRSARIPLQHVVGQRLRLHADHVGRCYRHVADRHAVDAQRRVLGRGESERQVAASQAP